MGVNSNWPPRPRTSSASRESAPCGSMRSRTAPASLSVTMVLASLVRSTPSNAALTSATSPAPASASVPSSLHLAIAGDVGRQREPRRGELAQLGQLRGRGGAAHLPATLVEAPVEGGGGAGDLHALAGEGRDAGIAAQLGAQSACPAHRWAAARRQPSGITTEARLGDHRLFTDQREIRELPGGLRQRHFARIEGDACAFVGQQVETRAGARDRHARDGEFAHLEHDGVDGMRRRREQQHRSRQARRAGG